MPCQPCTPPQDEFPIFCDPNPATDVGQRLLVEDEAFCTKALVSPETGSTLVWEDGIKWSDNVLFLNKTGDTMTGTLTLASNPTTAFEAATKQYVDDEDALKVNKSGDTMTGALVVNSSISSNSTILANGNSSKIGYNTGAGGTITQGAGSKANPVTLNRPTGSIVTDSAVLNANTSVTFNLSNTVIEATDILIVSHISGGTLGSYNFAVAPAAGNANVTIRNITSGNLSEALTLRFIVLKSVNS